MDGTFNLSTPQSLADLHAWLANQPDGLSNENVNRLCFRLVRIGGFLRIEEFFSRYPQVKVTTTNQTSFYAGGCDVTLQFHYDGREVEHTVQLW